MKTYTPFTPVVSTEISSPLSIKPQIAIKTNPEEIARDIISLIGGSGRLNISAVHREQVMARLLTFLLCANIGDVFLVSKTILSIYEINPGLFIQTTSYRDLDFLNNILQSTVQRLGIRESYKGIIYFDTKTQSQKTLYIPNFTL